MRKILLALAALLVSATAYPSSLHVEQIKSMFHNMVEEKKIALMPRYYDINFELYSNGKTMSYTQFVTMHEDVYKTDIQYDISYDENAWVENGDKLAGRVFITTTKPGKPAKEIEVILIAQYHNNKLYKLWELTYPDWSSLKRFKSELTQLNPPQ